MASPVSALVVDARGKACPLPILELARAMRPLVAGAEVTLLATDPAVGPDVRAFCEATGDVLVSFDEAPGDFRAVVRKLGRTAGT